jgi:glycosyltransferase involved in cell wall biosynthesis
MKTKICHIFSDVQQGSFFKALYKSMKGTDYEVCFVMVGPKPNDLFDEFKKRGYEIFFVELRSRKQIFTSILRMIRTLRAVRPEIVHTHLVDASLVGLVAASLVGINKRLSYRHHSNECHEYFPHAVYYDKLINRLSHRVVANTAATEEVLTDLEHVAPDKVSVINYAYDLSDLEASEDTVRNLRDLYHLNGYHPVVGAVSRFVHWKGVQYIVPAFKLLLREYPKAKLVLANGVGTYSPEIYRLLEAELEPNQYEVVEFERQIYSLYKTFDVFVHVPIGRYNEAFGQTYVEALALGIPSVFTMSGVANDFIVNEENALVVPYCNSEAICKAITTILVDSELRARISKRGRQDVNQLFGLQRLRMELEALYSKV